MASSTQSVGGILCSGFIEVLVTPKAYIVLTNSLFPCPHSAEYVIGSQYLFVYSLYLGD